jgi:hypothetical protein
MRLCLRIATLSLAVATGAIVLGNAKLAYAHSGPWQQDRDQSQQDRDRDDRDSMQDKDRDHDRQSQTDRDHQWEGDRGDYSSNPAYQQGLRQGQDDRTHNRAHQYRHTSGNEADRRAYQAGYDQGYSSEGRGEHDHVYGNSGYGQDRDDRDRDRSSSVGYGHGQHNAASQYGFQDGMNDGIRDRQTGHSYRPTEGDNYKNGSRGYSSSFGDRNQYKQMYRQAYEQGYQQGFNHQEHGDRDYQNREYQH